MLELDRLQELKGREAGKTCLIIGGGPSVERYTWEGHFDVDVQIAINGAIQGCAPDYWLCLEGDDQRLIQKWYALAQGYRHTTCLLHVRPGPAVYTGPKTYFARRSMQEHNPREVSKGFMLGGPREYRGTTSRKLGTSAMSALHLAAFLGCDRIATVGLDLCFKEGQHHWYDNPPTEATLTPWGTTAVEFAGLQSLDWWEWSAELLIEYRETLRASGAHWFADYSDGMLQAKGFKNE